MSTSPRTATVSLLVIKPLEIDEPDWCAGHPAPDTDGARAHFKPDITHYGPEQVIEINDYRILTAMLAQSPYALRASRNIDLYVETGDFTGSYAPAEIEQLADAFTRAAEQLRALSRDLARLRDGGAQ
ncbi:DUF6907 domain-containing protein [Streptomyces collinus]|uniref:DUF6907 domain-containing protein n=1 Tax=Streptomyces collinus TaxID=42684 RepID=UPI0036966FCD